ncbi:hypothetical protein [Nonomuraea maheshkhaliensis]
MRWGDIALLMMLPVAVFCVVLGELLRAARRRSARRLRRPRGRRRDWQVNAAWQEWSRERALREEAARARRERRRSGEELVPEPENSAERLRRDVR